MSEELETLLHERADAAAFEPVDLAAVTRAGRRQVRRRRAASALGVAAVLAVAGTGVGVLAGGHHSGGGEAADPTPPPQVSWASGSTIHQGSTDIDVGHTVLAYVRTNVGYVFTDGTGTVYSAVAGQVTPVGKVSQVDPRLVADADGSTAGWVDPSGSTPTFQVVDQTTGRTRSFDASPGTTNGRDDSAKAAYFYALGGRVAYWHDASGVIGTDLDADDSAPSLLDDSVLAVGDGVVVTAPNGQMSPVTVKGAGHSITLPGDAEGPIAYLSPDAQWVATDADAIEVYDTSSGAPVRFDLTGYSFTDAIGWLDAQTVEVFAQKTPNDDFRLFTCTVPEGHCSQAVADLGSGHGPDGAFAIPVGQSIAR